jgi:hypothetical protein
LDHLDVAGPLHRETVKALAELILKMLDESEREEV